MKNTELNPIGLSTEEARKLQEQYGKNELSVQKKREFYKKGNRHNNRADVHSSYYSGDDLFYSRETC